MATDIAHFIKTKNIGNCFIMGHSMGAKAVMTLLCKHPELYPSIKGVSLFFRKFLQLLFSKAIIVDMLPVNFMTGKYQQQYQKQKLMFERLANLKLNYFKSWVAVKKEIHRICSSAQEADFIATNLQVKYQGKRALYSWKVNIQGITRDYENLWEFVPTYSVFDNSRIKFIGIYIYLKDTRYTKPFQIIFGAESTLTNHTEDAEQFQLIFDKNQIDENLIVVQNARHWVHFDQPKQFMNIVSQFIKQNI